MIYTALTAVPQWKKPRVLVSGEFVLKSQHLVTPSGVVAGGVHVAGGVIQRVLRAGDVWPECPTIDAGEAWILPGCVDIHVHCNEPGRTEWEGFETATAAAAAGGITTLVDMPLNSSPVTTSTKALQKKLEAARGKLHVDLAFHAGLIRGNAAEIPALLDAGCVGVKAFLVHSGIDEFPNAVEEDLRAVMPELAKRGVPLLVHAELEEACELPAGGNGRSYARYLASRPTSWERAAIEMMIRLCREYRCPVHIVHLSAADALPMLAAARAEGLPITVETCPHYLYFDAERIPDGDTRFKCAPPIRNAANREALWRGLETGVIDLIASDHSPCEPSLKGLESGDFTKAWGGISSLQWMLPVIWTEARRRGIGLERVAAWLADRPAKRVGLATKGRLEANCDADLIIFNPEMAMTVVPGEILHRHKVTPYEGEQLMGVVQASYVRGELAFDHGTLAPPGGRVVSSAVGPIERLNRLPAEALRQELERCCGSRKWVSQMVRGRPFTDLRGMLESSEVAWPKLGREDWMDAFAHHPKIGDVASLRKKFASTANWASGEQAGASAASEQVLIQLAAGNEAYERKFGYIFIVCATGKSAAEMLAILESRLPNPGDKELAIAAAEQMKITRLRLEKLLA